MSNDLQESQNMETRFALYRNEAELDLKALGVTIVDVLIDEYKGTDTEWDDVVDVINKAIKQHRERPSWSNIPMTVPFPLLEMPKKKKFTVTVQYEIPVEAFTVLEAEEFAEEGLDGIVSIGDDYCEASNYFSLSVEEA